MNTTFGLLLAALSFETRHLIAGLLSLAVTTMAAYIFLKRNEQVRLRDRKDRLVKEWMERGGPIEQDPNYVKLKEIEKKLETNFNLATRFCLVFFDDDDGLCFGFFVLGVLCVLYFSIC